MCWIHALNSVHVDDPGIVLECRFWFSRSGVDPRRCLSKKVPGATSVAGEEHRLEQRDAGICLKHLSPPCSEPWEAHCEDSISRLRTSV